MFNKIGLLKNFTQFTGEELWNFFLNKVPTCNFIKAETLTQVFSVTFAKILRTPTNICKQLLLKKEASRVTTAQSKTFQKFVFFVQKSWFFSNIKCLYPKNYEVMLIFVSLSNQMKIKHVIELSWKNTLKS